MEHDSDGGNSQTPRAMEEAGGGVAASGMHEAGGGAASGMHDAAGAETAGAMQETGGAEQGPAAPGALGAAPTLHPALEAAVLGVSRDGDGKHPFCWLCRYQANRTTNEVIRFIMDAVPHMALDALVEQSKFFLDKVDKGSCCSFAQVRTHITTHMLHPRVKLALQLQDMARMQQEVAKCCVVNDVESGEKTVNTNAMRVYLTLCNQVVGVYKLGEERLTFNNAAIDK